jgi:GTP pyrophosphokinase/guanosine-3',5'-bis(diphosphate) 3'-pyrophosphohydrolase
MLAQALRAEGLQLPDESEAHAALWQQITRWSGNRNRAELLTDLGLGRKIASIVAKRIARLLAEEGQRPDALTLTLGRYASDENAPMQGMVQIDGSEGASVQLAPCCRPIPGDAIVGYLGRGEGLTVHTADCSVGKRLFERDSERWMTVEWAEQPVRAFETAINVLLKNGKGVLAEVASAVASAEADITHIDMGDERAAQTSELRLLLSVRDRLHLADVMRTLKRQGSVLRVARVKP